MIYQLRWFQMSIRILSCISFVWNTRDQKTDCVTFSFIFTNFDSTGTYYMIHVRSSHMSLFYLIYIFQSITFKTYKTKCQMQIDNCCNRKKTVQDWFDWILVCQPNFQPFDFVYYPLWWTSAISVRFWMLLRDLDCVGKTSYATLIVLLWMQTNK